MAEDKLYNLMNQELSLDGLRKVIKIIEETTVHDDEQEHIVQDGFAEEIFEAFAEGELTREEMIEYSKLMVKFFNLPFSRWYA